MAHEEDVGDKQLAKMAELGDLDGLKAALAEDGVDVNHVNTMGQVRNFEEKTIGEADNHARDQPVPFFGACGRMIFAPVRFFVCPALLLDGSSQRGPRKPRRGAWNPYAMCQVPVVLLKLSLNPRTLLCPLAKDLQGTTRGRREDRPPGRRGADGAVPGHALWQHELRARASRGEGGPGPQDQ